MISKYGFNEGALTPDNIILIRAAYIQRVNKIARDKNSQVRAVAYNRAGLHNWCMVLFISLDDALSFDDLSRPVKLIRDDDRPVDSCDPDKEMLDAIAQAEEEDIDARFSLDGIPLRQLDILRQIITERDEQDIEHGAEQIAEPTEWLTYIVEELGEVARAYLYNQKYDYRNEMIQLAAIVMAAIESFDLSQKQENEDKLT